jgi:hypothetical protein
MTPPLKINDPMKTPETKPSCFKGLKQLFCGRNVKKIEPQDAPLSKSPPISK